MPEQGDLKECGPADANGEMRERIQTNGRCEASNARGDTYGPRLLSRVRPGLPRLRLDREVGRALGRARDLAPLRRALPRRPRARRAALRRQPPRRDARLRVGRVPVHALRLELEHERRDHARVPDLRLLARLVRLGAGRGVALAGWTKFAALLLAPLWLAYPNALGWPLLDRRAASGAGLRGSPSPRWRRSRSSCSSPIRSTRRGSSASARSASSSTASRRSRSGAGGSTARRASPTSTSSSRCSRWCSSQAPWRSPSCRAAARRSSSPRYSAAVLIGFELVLTHWFYLYIPWFFPFVAFAVLSARDRVAPVH